MSLSCYTSVAGGAKHVVCVSGGGLLILRLFQRRSDKGKRGALFLESRPPATSKSSLVLVLSHEFYMSNCVAVPCPSPYTHPANALRNKLEQRKSRILILHLCCISSLTSHVPPPFPIPRILKFQNEIRFVCVGSNSERRGLKTHLRLFRAAWQGLLLRPSDTC